MSTFEPGMIHKDIPIPLHYQLSELLQQEIAAGRWKVGERIPTEEELCTLFQLSRTTVRKALDALVVARILVREPGRGTFVARPKVVEGLVNRPVGFYEDMLRQGIQVCTRVLELEQVEPPPHIVRELALKPGESVIKLNRLRCIESFPILLVVSYLPYRLVPGLMNEDLTKTGLYTLLSQKYRFEIKSARRYVEAVAANDYEATVLEVPAGSPLLLIESTAFLADGTPIEHFKSRHRGDRSRLIVETFSFDSLPIEADREAAGQ